MHIQIVNFSLNGLTHEQYVALCEERFAPVFAAVPGLISKIWLSDPAANSYGGVYLFEDKQALEAFQASELFQMTIRNHAIANLRVTDYGILEGPTRETNGMPQRAVALA